MQAQHQYVLEKIQSLCPEKNGNILDYGCGNGEIVVEGRKSGLNIIGVEKFYGGSNILKLVKEKGLLGKEIRKLEDGRIPFPDDHFDLVVSNQVFEHVEDLEHVLDEISRVLKSNGRLLSIFPSSDTIREGHCGIAFTHWIPKGTSYRYYWLLFFRKLGFGAHKGMKTPQEWARDFCDWLDKYVNYRSKNEIDDAFLKYFNSLSHFEDDYMSFRLENRNMRGLSVLASKTPMNHLSRMFFRKFGGLVFIAGYRRERSLRRPQYHW